MNADPPIPPIPLPAALTGRSALLDGLRPVLGRRPSVVVITGEAGVGKSRLVRELLTRTRSSGTLTLAARCQEPDAPFPYAQLPYAPLPYAPPPYAPLIEALSRCRPRPEDLPPVTGALRGLLPELADLLPPAPPPADDPRAGQHRVLRALCALTASLGKAVLAVEDLQWADESTVAFLRAVVSDPPPGLGLVLTARSHTLQGGDGLPFPLRPPAHVVVAERHLAPLSVTETGAMAAGLLGARAVPEEFAERLHRWTGGLPYVIEEVLREWSDTTACPAGTAGQLEPPLPASVRRVAVQRLRHLPSDARRVVAAAAVLSAPAPVHLLGAVAGLAEQETRRALAAALKEGVVRAGDGAYAFPYELARRAAYEAVAEPERPVLHLRAARALTRCTGPLPLVRVAEHYRCAGLRTQAVRCLEAAADRAARAGTPVRPRTATSTPCAGAPPPSSATGSR